MISPCALFAIAALVMLALMLGFILLLTSHADRRRIDVMAQPFGDYPLPPQFCTCNCRKSECDCGRDRLSRAYGI